MENEPHRFCLLRIDHDLARLLILIQSEEAAVGKADLTVRHALPLSPSDVLGNGAALLLCKTRHDGDEQLPLGIQGPDVFLLEKNLYALVLQLSHRGKAVYRVPCETAYALGDDKVDLPGKGICNHRLEALAFFGACRRYSFVRIYGYELPIVSALNVACVVIDLRLVACGLIFMVSGNAGISGNAAFLRAVYRCGRVSADGSRYRGYFSLRHDFPRSFRNCFMCSLIRCRTSGV